MTGYDLAPLARSLADPVVLVDVGVRWGFAARWQALLPDVRLIGFDADERECKRLRARYGASARIEAVALGEATGEAELRLASDPGSSSLLHTADEPLPGTEQIGAVTVPVRRLDDVVERADALKLDVQGAERAVLEGAPRVLAGAYGVELEVAFNPVYRDQPLFGELDALLRGAGFVLWRLDDLHHHAPGTRDPAPLIVERRAYEDRTVTSRVPGGQLFWGQATYVRPQVADAARAAVIAGALGLDDLAAAHLEAAGAREARAGRLRRRLARTVWSVRRRGVLGAARRLVIVRRLARQGHDAAEIAARTGLTEENVAQLLAVRLPLD